MAELTIPTSTSSCCASETQATCCDPEQKDACCGTVTGVSSCGCSTVEPHADIRETVRASYADVAVAVAEQRGSSACGCGTVSTTDATGAEVFGAVLYDAAEAGTAPVNASLGCGVPTAVADLHESETVLDLGSGAGADVLISARRVGPTGKAIGLDMTDEMLAFARANAAEAGLENVEFVKGYIEDIPLPDSSVDVVIAIASSTSPPTSAPCSSRLPGSCDPVAASPSPTSSPTPPWDEAIRADMAAFTGCIAAEKEFRSALAGAGLVDIEIRPTHRVHEHAVSAIVRARKPQDTP